MKIYVVIAKSQPMPSRIEKVFLTYDKAKKYVEENSPLDAPALYYELEEWEIVE